MTDSPSRDRERAQRRRRVVDRVVAFGRRPPAPERASAPPPSDPRAPDARPGSSEPPRAPIDDRAPSVDELKAEAGYRRDRLALYRRRVLTGKPSSAVRLRELERAAVSARDRLRRAIERRNAR
jgi:hypothetical protein